jgi:glycolate oxidase FAD binding subunit
LIARASFRLHPLPRASATVVLEAERPEDLAALAAVLLRSQLEPSALDLLHPGRLALLFEGSSRAVDAQVEATERLAHDQSLVTLSREASVWDESRRRQGEARGRLRFAPGELTAALPSLDEAVIRPAAGVAYLPVTAPDDTAPAARRLEEAIRAQLDPRGVLSE